MSSQFWQKVTRGSGRVLDPIDRNSEILFGLIMVLTFTGSVSAATAGREEIRTMLWAALGCNTAWGIVDAVMYLMSTLFERGHGLSTLKAIRKARSSEESLRIVVDALPPVVAAALRPEDVARIRDGVIKLPEPPAKPPITLRDLQGALGVFFIVFLSTVPVAIPFAIIHDGVLAMRVSNGVALLLLFLSGYYLGRQTGFRPFLLGFLLTIIGIGLVALTMVLGG
jgi:hypothetical protein